MSFWHSKNLTELTLYSQVLPWDFKMSEVSAQVRNDKKARQEWYRTDTTEHYFYTGIEAANPNLRPSKENPPKAIHAFAADYDLKIPAERVNEAIAAMPIKPSWVERSLGGNVRLVWLLSRPIPTETYEFCAFVLDKAVAWLHLGLLPGLDEAAFTSPTRLLCNGGDWTATNHPPIPESVLQAFFVSCGKTFRFKGAENGMAIPLDVVETELKKRYPAFNWPSDFVPDSQGPTFWIPESTSPTSAIVKPEGIITFAAHATKPFYSWSDLLGAEFVKQFYVSNIAKATQDIYYDGKKFWQKSFEEGREIYISMDAEELNNYLEVDCQLSAKAGPNGASILKVARRHIYKYGRVAGAAPFVFRPTGVFSFMGRRTLNTYFNRVIQPHPTPCRWPDDFPFIAPILDNLFDPKNQLYHFLAWWKYAYTAALREIPMPGQNIFILGEKELGKTLVNREMVGRSLGGHVDASSYLIKGDAFNSEMFEAPLWSIDDETASENESSRLNFGAMLKKSVANHTFKYNKKFEAATMLEWMGRICVTLNLDYVSSRLLGSMDNTSKDKTCLFRCTHIPFKFPARELVIPMIERDLPKICRYLLDWTPPDFVIPHVRYGYQSYHEPTLLDKAHQGGKAAPFKELLIESLLLYFENNPNVTEWRGTTTQLIRMLHANPLNEYVIRGLRIEQTTRYLEAIQREAMLECRVESGDMNQRLWVFPRFGGKK